MHFGIMLGRLTPSNGKGIQFFPYDTWKDEFELAAKVGLEQIEFIFDYERYNENPLWSSSGVKELRDVMIKTGVSVPEVCLDYFMKRPFYKAETDSESKMLRKENLEMIEKVAQSEKQIDAHLMMLALVDNASVKTEEQLDELKIFLNDASSIVEQYGVRITVESDFDINAYCSLLDSLDGRVGACYDIGDRASLGYNAYDEIKLLGSRIAHVHLKDRKYHTSSVPLGTGDADFAGAFKALSETGYSDSVIIQAAREKDGEEFNTTVSQFNFLKNHLTQ